MDKKKLRIGLASAIIISTILAVPFTGFPAEKSKKRFSADYPAAGKIERQSFLLDKLFATNAIVEKVAEGFVHASASLDYMGNILVADVSTNMIYRWSEQQGLHVFQPIKVYSTNLSGLIGASALSLDKTGNLIIAHHGDRRILCRTSQGRLISLADYFNWQRFNGPSSVTVKSNGDIYFTDPPYNIMDPTVKPPQRELIYNGIYRITKNGFVDLLSTKVTYPLGLAFTPKGTGLYVINADLTNPVVIRYSVKKDGTIENPEVFLSLTNYVDKIQPAGLYVDRDGNLYVASNAGIAIFSPAGRFLGLIRTDAPATSCTFDRTGKYLYITTRYYLCRVVAAGKDK